ncbi:Y-family DNA polymerase (plasmid) [Mucilaginibacter sp. PAMB04274]|uniref:Y-family DNA polymerase n=1 Tax=Mucilaginibacter sp. PAMB04274 TaxID=3138568 RepID=UPI0031F64C46
MIVHADCDAFYVSSERVFNPSLIAKPVVILSNGDHTVVALSKEAKALGIKRGDNIKVIMSLYGHHGLKALSSNYTLYGDMSSRVMEVFGQYTPDMEFYSIDEAFANLYRHKYIDLDSYVMDAKNKILQYTGIPVSVGIGQTKALAKTATKYAKKETPNGFYRIKDNEDRIRLLKWLPVGDVWGIGGKYESKLLAMGIETAYDFSIMPGEKVNELMTIVGYRLWCELNGHQKIDFEYEVPNKKGIGSAKGFGTKVTELTQLQEAMEVYLSRCCDKLRGQNLACKHLYIFLHTNPFATDEPQYYKGIEFELPVATYHTHVLKEEANKLLKKIYRKGFSYKRVGIYLSRLVPVGAIQADFFHNPNTERNAKLTEVLDTMNNRYGRDKLRFASMGYKHDWKARAEKLSLHFTTDKDDIIRIK